MNWVRFDLINAHSPFPSQGWFRAYASKCIADASFHLWDSDDPLPKTESPLSYVFISLCLSVSPAGYSPPTQMFLCPREGQIPKFTLFLSVSISTAVVVPKVISYSKSDQGQSGMKGKARETFFWGSR